MATASGLQPHPPAAPRPPGNGGRPVGTSRRELRELRSRLVASRQQIGTIMSVIAYELEERRQTLMAYQAAQEEIDRRSRRIGRDINAVQHRLDSDAHSSVAVSTAASGSTTARNARASSQAAAATAGATTGTSNSYGTSTSNGSRHHRPTPTPWSPSPRARSASSDSNASTSSSIEATPARTSRR